jgi:DNA ligase (NAD+)
VYTDTDIHTLHALTSRLIQQPASSPDLAEVAALSRVLRYHDWRYYVLSEPTLSDYDYDTLFKRLAAIEQQHPAWIAADSPTQRLSATVTGDLAQVTHLAAMLSLDNSYNEADITDFIRKVGELANTTDIAYCVEPKFDGASIALVYEGDTLIRAATRGDGAMGEDITHNARALHSIPLTAPFSKHGIHRIEIRGEVIIRQDVFTQMNEARREAGIKEFQNARNTASGSLRLKDPREAASRGLEAILYHVSYMVDAQDKNMLGIDFTTHQGIIALLHSCGFKTPIHDLKCCADVTEVSHFLHLWSDLRHSYPIDTDGMVIKVNDLRQQQLCGSTAHHPRWAIAYKFAARQAQSRLLHVDYQVGRTGAITPVAKIEPVSLSGVTIASISLHNEDFIHDKDIRLGDTVIVERAGEVIPYIVGSVAALRTGDEQVIVFPTTCPSCATALVRPEVEVAWRCDNVDCPAQVEERIIHYVSKGAMDVDGLGKSIVAEFITRGYIHTVEDIYRLPYNQIIDGDGWGDRSIENLKKGIEDSKNKPLWRLINALGIRHIGVTTAKDLAKQVLDLRDYATMPDEQLQHIEGIGPKVAQSIQDFFANAGNVQLLDALELAGVNLKNRPEDSITKTQKLAGKTFLFTGTLVQFTRDRAKLLVEEHGGALLSGISAKLSYLVAGAEAGSKLTKAKAIPTIQILTEDEFLAMIAE